MECHNNPLHQGECAKIWRADDLGDIELLHARYLKYSFAKHTHEGAAVGVIEDGAESFYYRGAIHTAPAGQIIVFNPYEAHTGQGADERGWRFRMFYLDSALLRRAAAELSDKRCDVPFFSSPIIDDPSLGSLLRNLHVSLEAGGGALERESKFLWTFSQLIARHADAPSLERLMGNEKTVVRAVRQYIEDHYSENVSLNDLAAVAKMSAYHMLRVFRSETGLPPYAYLEQVRVNRSRELLRGGISLTDVAFQTGFSDQSHFSRHFKKMTGVSPGQYQKTARSYKTSLPVRAQSRIR